MGGTGMSTQDRGMGGTGLFAQNLDRGMGGTGIIGTVIGFGSICVNGFRIAYDAATPVSANGVAASIDTLERGVTVAVSAVAQGGQLHASAIEIVHALVGPVTAAADPSGAIAVMGLHVESAHAAGLGVASLALGDVVVVDGLQRASGAIDATRIARAPPDAQASVRGALTDRTNTALRIGTITVTAAPGKLPAAGSWAVATGTWSSGALTADAIVVGTEAQNTLGGRISVEGYLLVQTDGTYTIRGVPVRESPNRGLDRAMFGRLAAGQRLQLLGQRERDGGLRVETVIVPDQLSPLSDNGSLSTAEAGAVTTSSAARTAARREQLQELHGVYGEIVTRPLVARETIPVVRPEAILTRPIRPPDFRPEIPRAPDRGGRPGR